LRGRGARDRARVRRLQHRDVLPGPETAVLCG
jgi:hypothetical protein